MFLVCFSSLTGFLTGFFFLSFLSSHRSYTCQVQIHSLQVCVTLCSVKHVQQHSHCLSLQEAKCGFAIILMALYWCTECIPLAVTALLPVILFPMMGIMESGEVFSNVYSINVFLIGCLLKLVWQHLFISFQASNNQFSSYFFPYPGLYPVPERLQHAFYWWAAGCHRCRALEPAQEDRPSSSANCGGETISVRLTCSS